VRVEPSVSREHFFEEQALRAEEPGVTVLDRIADRWPIQPDGQGVSL
jgi:hypothetical protein